MATTFGQIVDLDTDLAAIGVNNYVADIPILGAASTMALGWEGRRLQPMSQGDSRRASEIGPGTTTALSRQFAIRQKDAINGELSRLLSLFGYRTPDTSGPTTLWRGGSRW
jgi:hypothetical protein